MHGNLPHIDPITELGMKVFEQLGSSRPSAFNKNRIASQLMTWSMSDQQFKVNLFRLVDVLPQLRTSSEIATHVREYLHDVIDRLPGLGAFGALLRWGLRGAPHSLRARLVAYNVKWSVEQMARLFIAGENPHEALRPLRNLRAQKLAFTVDLLGEFCVSEREANDYLERYLDALRVIGSASRTWPERAPIIGQHPGEQSPVCVSVKLSALYSQCGPLNFNRSVDVLAERLGAIVSTARDIGAQVYVDAEDSGNNPIIYQAFERVFGSARFKDIAYPGIVVQAYAREARSTVERLIDFAARRGAPIAVRLVKGAYWDQETISAQQNGWNSPLFLHKQTSDANFESLSRLLIDNHSHVLPAFGSHNIRSLAHACTYASLRGLDPKDFELQMLYGMAEPIARAYAELGYLVRMYVPLGDMLVGMGYLVRRLLENTSNESFLKHTFFDADKFDTLMEPPIAHPEDVPMRRPPMKHG